MADTANSDELVFGLGNPMRRCRQTGRAFEVGSGALPEDQQTVNFVREAAGTGNMPKEGERCPQTGREYECGLGALSKERQTANFLNELSPAEKHQRATAAAALNAATPAGSA